MTKNEVLSEYQSCIEKYRKLLDRVYKIKNYSTDSQCKECISFIKKRINECNDSYKICSAYNESYFRENNYTDFFKSENSIINSYSSKIDRLTALYGRRTMRRPSCRKKVSKEELAEITVSSAECNVAESQPGE